MILGTIISKNDGALLEDPTAYRSLIIAMHYCTITTPNITFAINKSCQFLQALSTHQWVTTKRLLCYLKGTSNNEATLHKSSHMELIVFSDTD